MRLRRHGAGSGQAVVDAPGGSAQGGPRPSSRDAKRLLESWRATVADLREVVTPDPDGDNTAANYGSRFTEADYAPVPRGDLPFGAPAFLGDDAWVRAKPGGAQNSVERPSPDDGHTLIWHAPGG